MPNEFELDHRLTLAEARLAALEAKEQVSAADVAMWVRLVRMLLPLLIAALAGAGAGAASQGVLVEVPDAPVPAP